MNSPMSKGKKLIIGAIICFILGLGAFIGARDLIAFNNSPKAPEIQEIEEIQEIPLTEPYIGGSC